MRSRIATILAAAGVFTGVVFLPVGTTAERDPRMNVIVIVTDDQSFDSIPHDPVVMPYLQAATGDPDDHWIVFRNGFVTTPLCCPSRATLLTGRYPHHHGVRTNDDGHLLDESQTIATWLDAAGYHTGLVGKYLNQYPFERGAYVPEGWDRWWGKEQSALTSLYRDYTVVQQGVPVHYGSAEEDYATDVFGTAAVDFIAEAPLEQPFFLWFAPTAPHPPVVVAARHEGRYAAMPVAPAPSVGEADVSDKPAWVRALPGLGPVERAALRDQHRRSFEALLPVDEAVRAIVETLEARGDLDHTLIFYLSDNGFSFGEHRWVRKTCPYEECGHVPFLIRDPLASRQVERAPVSAVDLVPTILELLGIEPRAPLVGVSLAPLFRGDGLGEVRDDVFSEWVGDDRIPAWWKVRTADFSYIELGTGERELYDLRRDPYELVNVAADPRYAADLAALAARLAAFRTS
jgi:arylsulfatase A-like enzyme